MSDPTQQPPSDPYRPQEPYQPQAPYQGPGGPTPPPQQGPPQYGPGPYGAGPYQPYGRPPVPNHPQATTALVLGAVGLGSVVALCGLLLFISPVAWVMGSKALKEIDSSNGTLGGRNEALWGQITGIVGTVLLVLAIIAIVVIVILIVNNADSAGDYDYSYGALISLLPTAR